MQSAILLVNLGSPSAPTAGAVRKFLADFLSDRRVVELPALLWQPLLRGVILPLRSKRVAKLYQAIWSVEGSPLTAITIRQARALQACLHARGYEIRVRYAMSYSAPTIAAQIAALRAEGCERIVVLPLYPQYSGTTTGAVCQQLADVVCRSRYVPDLRIVREYCQREDYLDALAASISRQREQRGAGEILLFSYHGIPQACVDKGDPYYQQCLYTSQQVAARLQLEPAQWQMTFQSRFGKAAWLTPYTDEILAQLPEKSIRRVDVVCPAFAADCLETLEEIEHGSRRVFCEAGGEVFQRLDCLNDEPAHIDMMANIALEQLNLQC